MGVNVSVPAKGVFGSVPMEPQYVVGEHGKEGEKKVDKEGQEVVKEQAKDGKEI